MKEVPLTQGRVALVDDEDDERVCRHEWRFHRTSNSRRGLALTTMDGRRVLMHRMILEVPAGTQVDHINGDGCDNRRCNLRLAPTSVHPLKEDA